MSSASRTTSRAHGQNNRKVVLETKPLSRYSNFLPLVRAQNAPFSRGRDAERHLAIVSGQVLVVVIGGGAAERAQSRDLGRARGCVSRQPRVAHAAPE